MGLSDCPFCAPDEACALHVRSDREGNAVTYTDSDGRTHVQTGAYALPFAVLVRSGGTGDWGFYGTHRTYQAAWKRLLQARKRGGFDQSNSTIVEGEAS